MTTYAHQPIEVYLRQDEYDALQELATMRGVPLAELVHEGVAAVLHRASEAVDLTEETLTAEGPPDGDPLRDIIGMIDSGLGDLAENHDKYLVEILEAESHPWPAKFS